MSDDFDHVLTQARDSLDMDQKLEAARQLAQAGKLLEGEGKPGRAMAVYQLAHELGANASPAMFRLTSAGAEMDKDYLREARRWLGGLDFPQPPAELVHQCKPMLNMLLHVAEEMLGWMSRFPEEQVKATPWPPEGYQRFRELVDPSEGGSEDSSPQGWQIWRTYAPVAGLWGFLELTRARNPQCEAIYRTYMEIGGPGARLYRRIAMARHFLRGHEPETLVPLVGASPASQASCFAGLFMWDHLNPEKSEPDWPTRARGYVKEPALVCLTGMFSTLLEKLEGTLAVKLEA